MYQLKSLSMEVKLELITMMMHYHSKKQRGIHSVNLIDSVYRSGKSYYPHVLLEECKCIVADTAIKRYTRFFSKSFNKKLSLKTPPKTLRKCQENLQLQLPEPQF